MSHVTAGTDAAADEPVLSRLEGSILVLTLNRPERLNAVSLPMYELLRSKLVDARGDKDVRCVVLTGAGRAFCVGADLKAHEGGPPTGQDRKQYVRAAQRVNLLIQAMRKPVVAAVNGHAIGGGLEMALSSDFMVVAEDAKMRFPEIAIGTFIGGGTAYTLIERVGTLKARQLIYLGDFFLGREAADMGIAYKACPADEVLPTTMELAGRLSDLAPISFGFAKRLLLQAATWPRRRTFQAEARALSRIFGTRDWAEGVAAFAEKRKPEFTGE